jgi:hypothetical protein
VSGDEYFERNKSQQFLKPGHTNIQLLQVSCSPSVLTLSVLPHDPHNNATLTLLLLLTRFHQHWLAGDEEGLSNFLKKGIDPAKALDGGAGAMFGASPRFAWEAPDMESSEPRILRDFNRLVTKRTGPIGALVRLTEVTPEYADSTSTKTNYGQVSAKRAAAFCGTFNDVDEVLILLRTDLMRWSLSEYDAVHLRGKEVHLQFANVNSKDRRVEMHHVDIKALTTIAHKRARVYGKKARYAKELNKCGKKVTFVQYEYFLDSSPTCPQLEAPTAGSRVHRVHSSRLADFVENSDEVFALFAGERFPSFSQLYTEIFCGGKKGGCKDIFFKKNFYKLGDIPGDAL